MKKYLSLIFTAMMAMFLCVDVAAAEVGSPDIAPAICINDVGNIITAPADGMESSFSWYEVTEVASVYVTENPSIAAAICKDAFGNTLISNGDGYVWVIEMCSMIPTDMEGNIICKETGKVLAKAPFAVGDETENSLTLIDADGNVLLFDIENQEVVSFSMLAPAIYMDGQGRIITVDYFGRETVLEEVEI